ncbi:MAG: hypothetical protein WD156_08790 [Acidimicrobiia bacterium]
MTALLSATGFPTEQLEAWRHAGLALQRVLGAYERWEPLWALGWSYGSFSSVDLYDDAVHRVQNGDPEGGEQLLEDGWNEEDRLSVQLVRLAQISVPTDARKKVGNRRADLIRKALEDHKSGRFHASVPVVIAQTEGIVRDVFGTTPYSPYGGPSDDLTAVGHPEARALFDAGRRPRPRTHVEDDPPFPSRHGVLHGRSLGYDTRRNSTKVFVTLFAVIEACGQRLRTMSRDKIDALDRKVFEI